MPTNTVDNYPAHRLKKCVLCLLQVKVGTWNSVDRLSLAREEKDDGNLGEVHPMANKTFVITTVLVTIQWQARQDSMMQG